MRKEDIRTVIRGAVPGDVEAVCDLWEQLFLLHARLDPIFTPSKDGRIHYRRWVLQQIAEPDSVVLVAEEDGRVVGYCMAQVQALPPVMRFQRIGLISDMCVDESVRGRRIGREIYARMEARLRDRGIRRVELKTSSFNPGSNHFWEATCGFREFVKVRYKNID